MKKTEQKGFRLTPSEVELLASITTFVDESESRFIMKAVAKEARFRLNTLNAKQSQTIEKLLDKIESESIEKKLKNKTKV
ncbi:MAG: hypothetical protein EOP06_01035 [Proteobacteria bacterium]|nr:MAG: hypothetical protein EOP06_01035 [Pseudomonadota bacterium]